MTKKKFTRAKNSTITTKKKFIRAGIEGYYDEEHNVRSSDVYGYYDSYGYEKEYLFCYGYEEDNLFRNGKYPFIREDKIESYVIGKTKEEVLESLENPSEKLQLKVIKECAGFYIQYFKNPSEKVQLAAVKEDWKSIQYIKKPSLKVQLEAAKRSAEGRENNFDGIRHIKNVSEQDLLKIVKKDGTNIQYIQNPSEKVQIKAVKEYGSNIRYIKNPSEQVQLEAVKKDGYFIQYIRNPSENVQLEAIKQNVWNILYIKNPSEQVQLEVNKKLNLIEQITITLVALPKALRNILNLILIIMLPIIISISLVLCGYFPILIPFGILFFILLVYLIFCYDRHLVYYERHKGMGIFD